MLLKQFECFFSQVSMGSWNGCNEQFHIKVPSSDIKHYFSLLQSWTIWTFSEKPTANVVILLCHYGTTDGVDSCGDDEYSRPISYNFPSSLCLCQDFLSTVLDVLTPEDVRLLAESEDELTRLGQFERIFPSPSSSRYLRFFECSRYLNILLDQWEQKHWNNRTKGICDPRCAALIPLSVVLILQWYLYFLGVVNHKLQSIY